MPIHPAQNKCKVRQTLLNRPFKGYSAIGFCDVGRNQMVVRLLCPRRGGIEGSLAAGATDLTGRDL